MTKNAYFGPILAVFGPKILIFRGVSKRFSTNITENHLDNLSALFFGQALDQICQKCRYLAQNASFGLDKKNYPIRSGSGNNEKKKETLQDSNLLTRGGSGNKEAKRGSKLLGSPCHRQPWSSRHRSFLWVLQDQVLEGQVLYQHCLRCSPRSSWRCSPAWLRRSLGSWSWQLRQLTIEYPKCLKLAIMTTDNLKYLKLANITTDNWISKIFKAGKNNVVLTWFWQLFVGWG